MTFKLKEELHIGVYEGITIRIDLTKVKESKKVSNRVPVKDLLIQKRYLERYEYEIGFIINKVDNTSRSIETVPKQTEYPELKISQIL